jgi:hypothetical protein
MDGKIGMDPKGQPRIPLWRILGWGGAVALVLAPLVARQFTAEVQWDETDFIIATVIFGIIGALVELTVRLTANPFARAGSFLAILAGLMVLWANLSVGMIGEAGNPVNLLFGVVLLIAVAGAWLSMLHWLILPSFMLAAGVTQFAIGLFAGILASDFRGGLFTILLSTLWWLASVFFAIAGRSQRGSV